jgi:hypothetical protein
LILCSGGRRGGRPIGNRRGGSGSVRNAGHQEAALEGQQDEGDGQPHHGGVSAERWRSLGPGHRLA